MATLTKPRLGKPLSQKCGFQGKRQRGTLSGVDMKIDQIIRALKQMTDREIDPESFIYDFLSAFNIQKATITRLKEGGDRNMTKIDGAVLLKDKLFFSPVLSDLTGNRKLEEALEEFRANKTIAKNKPQFFMVTDYKRILAFDTKQSAYVDFPIENLAEEYMFFLQLAGMSATKIHEEAEADTKAADRMAKLYDQIVADNPPANDADRHALNLFLTRLLFCYFAEDTNIFGKRQFTDSVETYTHVDGSDVSEQIGRIFETLSLAPSKRKNLPPHLSDFRYVNGGLFNDEPGKRSPVPKFNTRSRTTLIALGDQSWAEINPDIFGSMFQGVIDEGKRGSLGMHYTSVPNIMKVIEPLFLNDLRDQFQKAKGSSTRLNKLLHRIYHIRIFDPACGSGNFLIIAYKELRKLEMDIFHELDRVENRQPAASPFADSQANFEETGFRGKNEQPPLAIAQSNLRLPGIHVSQFFGIEIDDFASEVAILAMWLAEHQMNVAFKASFGHSPAPLPLKDGAHITHGNSLREDWKKVCPTDNDHEVFVLGNPPYLGSSLQDEGQKADVAFVFKGLKDYKNLDFISCWFVKASRYLKGSKARSAFVTTNSICQGEQVAMLWPHIFNNGIEIGFAHLSFKWTNNAKSNAGVTCVIIGLQEGPVSTKTLISGGMGRTAKNINAYLVDAKNVFITKRRSPISKLRPMDYGSKPTDGGNLILSRIQMVALLDQYPVLSEVIHPFVGAEDYIESNHRYCLWFTGEQAKKFADIPEIAIRLNKVRDMRLASPKAATRRDAEFPHKFSEPRYEVAPSILIPRHSSERRKYIPFGYLPKDAVVADSASAIYHAEPWIFAIISSRIHLTWTRAIAGRLEERIRYSNTICYNNFPFPNISDSQKKNLNDKAEAVLAAREEHPEKTIAQLYDPEKMPMSLLAAHRALDLAVEKCYRDKPFPEDSDEERLEFLFKLYLKMTGGADENLEMELEDA